MQFGPERFVLLSALNALLLSSVSGGNSNNVSMAGGFVCGTKYDTNRYSTSLVTKEATTRPPYIQLPERISPGFSSSQNVLWRITKYPEVYSGHTTVESLEAAAGEAFQLWSSVSNLNFYHDLSSPTVHIEFKFEVPVSHNLYCAEDFELNEFGHYVQKTKNPAQIHINANVLWTTDRSDTNDVTDDSVNLVFVLAHEIGHAMGFGHNNLTDSVMFLYTYRQHSGGNVALSSDDINAAVERYGPQIGGLGHRFADEYVAPRKPSVWESFRDLPGDLKLLWKGLKGAVAKIFKKQTD